MESLRLLSEHLYQSLNTARSVQIHRHLDERGHHSLDQLLERGHCTDFNELLAKIVTELVHHDFWQNLEHDVNEAGGKDFSLLNLVFL